MRKVRKIIGRIILVLLWFDFVLIGIAAGWYCKNFAGNTMNDIIFTLEAPIEGTDSEMVHSFLMTVLAPSVVFTVLIVMIGVLLPKLSLHIRTRKVRFYPQLLLALVLIPGMCTNIVEAATEVKLWDYVRYRQVTTTIYEDYYVDPATVQVTFPEEKRNLIYIVMESMETTFQDKASGGAYDVNLIPNLTAIAQENTSFSDNEQLVGAQILPGTGFTIGSIVAQTSGIPLTIPIDGNSYTGYGRFLPGTYTLGEILAGEGYRQIFLCGSDATFGGRRDYFTLHGNYEIMDYNYAIEQGELPEDYLVWWGYEDAKLYDFAKKELSELASGDQPFNFTMLTADTHHVGGYVCDLCEDIYDEQYANVIACADQQVQDFVDWIMEQEFYKNTTVVIVGDHPSMDPEFFVDFPEDYRRATYNVFLNPAVDTLQTDNRIFSLLDMYPTTLASLGATVDGERLGLGTNLFSTKETLLEELNVDYVEEELQKNSDFYNRVLLYNK